MKFSTVCQLALASAAAAAPTLQAPSAAEMALLKARASGYSDADILNFALTLEHLEATFYRQSLNMLSESDFAAAKYPSSVRQNMEEVAADEAEHVKFLTAALKAAGASAVPACKYDFGVTDVKSFMQTAGILEGVGITAYLGAAQLISSPTYLTAAGSILTVESRHSAYIRNYNQPEQSPFPFPFDVPQDPMAVYTLASQFITKCPKSADLGIKSFPLLSLKAGQNSPINAGKSIIVEPAKGAKITKMTNAYFAGNVGFIPAKFAETEEGYSVTIPEGVAGQSYLTLANTADPTKVSDSNIVAGPAIVMVQSPYTHGGFHM